MNQIKIGKFIAERRKERGFLQKDIAKGALMPLSFCPNFWFLRSR